MLSSTLGTAVLSLLCSSAAFWPRQYPSSLLHAKTIWHGFVPSFLLERMVFPSTKIIFLSLFPSLLSSSSCHFLWSCWRFSDRIIPMTRCMVLWEGILFLSPIYCLKYSSFHNAKFAICSHVSVFARVAKSTMIIISFIQWRTFLCCLTFLIIYIHSNNCSISPPPFYFYYNG